MRSYGRPSFLTLLLIAVSAAPAGLAQAGRPVWRSAIYGAQLADAPAGWVLQSPTEQSFTLTKSLERDGLELEERISLQVAYEPSGDIERVIAQLGGDGYRLLEQARVPLDDLGAPIWLLSGPGGPEESALMAVTLRGGKVFAFSLRSSPLDLAATDDFMQVLKGFRLIPDPREEGWNALARNDGAAAERQFDRLLSANRDDANARYGLGLAKLARGDTGAAVRELDRAALSLGLEEDVRRALGRAEFDRGRLSRAAGLWVQVLRADAGWDAELRPSIARAVAGLGSRSSNTAIAAAEGMSAASLDFLSRVSSGNDLALSGFLAEFRNRYVQLVEACLRAECGGRTGPVLMAGLDLEPAMTTILAGVQSGNEADVLAGQIQMADGFKAMAMESRQ